MSSNEQQDYPPWINPELNLDPPHCMPHVESDDEEDRYELWTVRIPVDMKVEELNGMKFQLDDLEARKKSGKAGVEINDGKHLLSLGDANENAMFRLLVPDSQQDSEDNSEDDDDDDETKNYFLHPCSKPFAKHFNVLKNLILPKTEAELAPSKGPAPDKGIKVRKAYTHIPQRTGLKRRWMPLGAPQGARSIPPQLIANKSNKEAVKIAASSDDDDNDTNDNMDVEVKEEKASSSPSKRRRNRSNSETSNKKKRNRSRSHSDLAASKPSVTAAVASPKKKRGRSNSNTSNGVKSPKPSNSSSTEAPKPTATEADSKKKKKRSRSSSKSRPKETTAAAVASPKTTVKSEKETKADKKSRKARKKAK